MKIILASCFAISFLSLHGTVAIKNERVPKFFKKDFAWAMAGQNGKTCLPSVMGYLNRYVCGGKNDSDYYIKAYEDKHPGIDVKETGVMGNKQQLDEYIASYFDAVPFRQTGGLRGSINAGMPILTTKLFTDEDGHPKPHSILIIGYDTADDTNPALYYMDPFYGHICSDMTLLDFNRSNPVFTLAVQGCKK